jgi:hypothetical protein
VSANLFGSAENNGRPELTRRQVLIVIFTAKWRKFFNGIWRNVTVPAADAASICEEGTFGVGRFAQVGQRRKAKAGPGKHSERLAQDGIYLPEAIAGAWERVAKNRYVAHMDMLGMSELTLRDPKLAWSAVSEMPLKPDDAVAHDGLGGAVARRTSTDTGLQIGRSGAVAGSGARSACRVRGERRDGHSGANLLSFPRVAQDSFTTLKR